MPARRAIREWEDAQRELAHAEIAALRWQLQNGGEIPPHMARKIEQLRDRANFLFETAAALLSPAPADSLPDTD